MTETNDRHLIDWYLSQAIATIAKEANLYPMNMVKATARNVGTLRTIERKMDEAALAGNADTTRQEARKWVIAWRTALRVTK